MEMTMYDTLLQLPLFQGLAKNDFTSILDKVKIHFLKRKAGDTVALGGEDCRELVFLLNGSLVSKTSDRDELYTFYEAINAPFLIEPYSLFGWSTKYVSTYTALTACNLVTIEKAYLLSELNNYEIIRLNYLNILSNRAQNLHDRLWTNLPESLHDRIVEFILLHSYVPGGEKRLKIKMDDLAKLLSSTRIRVSKALNEMQDKHWLTLHRGEIRIPDISLLKEHRDMRLSE
ncbi:MULTISPECIES: Crp/Fnr family transcriptional regulator [Bacteroidaceae]|jgi:CRP-like cAMP-binding protein|uniref:Crp/Fnr family transcriptional regulator n=1 Tax=Bacteroidaceae TaxID=815 RepID=UPI000D0B0806|nr:MULTISPECIES: Crp/Fnr family transcriptional regulator [Bacteroidaceae]MCL1607300.1 Crp/Fnr family transcriptional regulator [Mediterranea sp. ET5]MDM8122187.1 Crp/Fnr family transcriptional regulator [Mediterranea massiliensis]MDM8198700.1 Crp/Fnr family transcriptional regulator [Mediterranea massiliensis]